MPDKTAESTETAIRELVVALPKGAFKTVTVDRGKEFACYETKVNEFIKKTAGINPRGNGASSPYAEYL